MSSDMEFRLRMRVEPNSPQALVLNYLNSKQTPYPSKDMAMIALTSYWLPLACQNEGMQSSDFNRTIRNSIYRLKLHVQYLQQMLGEEVGLEEMVLLEPKVAALPLETPLEEATTQRNSAPSLNGNSPESQSDATEGEGWFNPLKSNSKSSN